MALDRRAVALAAAVAIAMPMEGLRRAWYVDPASIVTVCWGHTGPDIDKSKVYSHDECKRMLNADMLKAIDAVERCQPGLPPTVLASFADITFNAGPTAACDTAKSTAARFLRAKDYKSACGQLLRWDKARVAGVMVSLPGLTKRRAMERDLCLSGL